MRWTFFKRIPAIAFPVFDTAGAVPFSEAEK
jgi:hypothetical protein